jgi:hypothetical protein
MVLYLETDEELPKKVGDINERSREGLREFSVGFA